MRPSVLIVDDSAFARTMLSRMLQRSHRIDVVGTACDGLDALERIAELDPDVVTLDLMMPQLDGLGVLRALAGRPRPRVIVVSISSVDTALGAEALALGAVDLVAKPTALASDRLQEIEAALTARILAIAGPAAAAVVPPARGPALRPARGRELIVLGTSTGGPQALTRLVAALPAGLAVPLLIALHIPAGYTEALAQRFDRLSPLRVVEARDGLALTPGLVVLARGGSHLRVARSPGGLRAEVSPLPVAAHVPSVDELFVSAARAVGAGCLGIVLTGMGDDGLIGARAIAAAGGALITEAAATCVVYGMPRAVHEAGLGAVAVPLHHLIDEIAHHV